MYSQTSSPSSPEPAVAFQAEPFDLSQVTLLEGPFRNAMLRNAEWLVSLEPDRFLAWFRKEAGLEPKGEVYGGWESLGLAGQSLGHYLSALAMQYRATGDGRFKERADYVVAELAECQAAHGNGYVAAIPAGRKVFEEISRGEVRSAGFDLNGAWVPWYVMDKMFSGLNDVYLLAKNEQALDVANKLADWAYQTTKILTDEQWQGMLGCEFGGMSHSLADLYAITGNPMHLALAKKFYHEAVMTPLAEGRDALAGLHANTQVPKARGAARIHELTGEPDQRAIATFFWDRVVHHHSYVNGGNSADEHFGPPDQLSSRMHDTTETCNTYNMLRLTRHLFSWEPRAELIDYYERALYNHILASQHPETGMVKYKGFLDMPTRKNFSHATDSWWCCVGTGLENHTKYGESIFFHSGDSLYLNLFFASELSWAEKGVSVRQETAFPAEDITRLRFSSAQPVELNLLIRDPEWCEAPRVSVNGTPQSSLARRDGFIEISRTFADGDVIEVQLPMSLRIEAMPDNPRRIAFLYGPVLLSADLKGDGNIPVLLCARAELLNALEPVEGEPLQFRAKGIGRILDGGEWEVADLDLKPHYRITDELYTVYLDAFSGEQWIAHQAEIEAELERLHEIEARTLGVMRLGEMQTERDHKFEGERTRTGKANGKRWRDAYDGGWFASNIGVAPDGEAALQVTYWGSDRGQRAFDILIDDRFIATQHLANRHPNNFFDVTYPIPAELTRGKETVRVKFQALPGQVAGGVFGCRTIRFDRSETEARNPLFQGADPDLLLVDDRVWVYPTHRNGQERRFFAYSSDDLVNWRIHGPILDFGEVDWIPEDKQAWAPGVAQKNGKFYLYYSVGPKPSHIGVAVADSPAGPFLDSGGPLLSDNGDPAFEAIDAMAFTDPRSGKSYLYAGGSAGSKLRVWELNDDMISFAREIETETPPNFTEGPFMHTRDGLYYLSYSHGLWWDGSYTVGYATSETPYGPWTYHGAIMESDENHRGPGHHSILHNPKSDEWFILYHRWNGQREPGPYNAYRQTAIDQIRYDTRGLIEPVKMTDTAVGPCKLGAR